MISVTLSVSEGAGRSGARRTPGSLANPRDDNIARDNNIATAHGIAVYFDAIAQPSAQAPPFASSRDQRSYDRRSRPRTPHSLHAQPAMIISAGVNASMIAD